VKNASISGLVLEERICSGGCGKVFRVMPGSKQRTARGECKIVCDPDPHRKMTVEERSKINGRFFPPK